MLYIYPINQIAHAPQKYGGKAEGLYTLHHMGLPIPKTFVLEAGILDNEEHSVQIIQEIEKLILEYPSDAELAIRSSALGEDGIKNSFAGIFETHLNIPLNVEAIFESCMTVHASNASPKTKAYKDQSTKMGIVIQEMIDPLFSGVAFTKSLNELGEDVLLLEFVEGLGDKLVNGLVTSEKITVPYNQTQNLIQNNVDYITEQAQEIQPYQVSLLNVLEDINHQFQIPMDIEWAIDYTGMVWILQARPITEPVFVPTYNKDAGSVASFGQGSVTAQSYYIGEHLSEKDLTKKIADMPAGSILILDSSDTEYLPAMTKASAIISTQGSILAHTAIVARELGIPCIVGCKSASGSLPDGTEVTVNPSTGSISSEHYSSTGNTNTIDWGDLCLFDNIDVISLGNEPVLFQKNPDSRISAYTSPDADKQIIHLAEVYARKTYHQSPRHYKHDKYLWYFEQLRFQKIPLFVQFIEKGKYILRDKNPQEVRAYFQELREVSLNLVQRRDQHPNPATTFLINETLQSLHYAVALWFAQGEGIREIYTLLRDQNMTLTEFFSLNDDSLLFEHHPDLKRLFHFSKGLEQERNQIYAQLISINALDTHYFDTRESQAEKALYHMNILYDANKNIIDVFYENIDILYNDNNRHI